MTTISRKIARQAELRSLAIAQLKGAAEQARVDASNALRVLFELASSPSTAPNALALLHELQVHQVEVDIQDEELRRSRVELEASLHRQVQLYDYGPMGQFSVDGNGVLRELNRTGATLLGVERDLLLGRSLESFLTPDGGATLRTLLKRVAEGAPTAFGDLDLRATPGGPERGLHASVSRDPRGEGFLIGLMGAAAKTERAQGRKV